MNIQIGGARALNTYVFSEEELRDRELDFIGGFEIIDNQFRMYCVEGISAKGMARLEELVPREAPNSAEFNYLKNREILFKERLYASFNL